MQHIQSAARSFGVELDENQVQAFETLYQELAEWNGRMNLTSIIARDQVLVKHFLDSLSVAPFLTVPSTLIDIGTGAGFPGLPLKIAFPPLAVTLIEATRKKVDFLKHMIERLDLQNVLAIQARAEDVGQDPAYREQYDRAVARAVADLSILLEYALPLVRVGGVFIAQKGVAVQDEVDQAAYALATLGGRVREIVPVQLPGLEPRHLILVEKVAPTPKAYPRRAGLPERKPLRRS